MLIGAAIVADYARGSLEASSHAAGSQGVSPSNWAKDEVREKVIVPVLTEYKGKSPLESRKAINDNPKVETQLELTSSSMNLISASGEVLKVYQTGDRPILVLCSDGSHYICKYKQPGYAAYKLLNELVGGMFAKAWGIATPVTSLVVNDPIIWDGAGISHDPLAPLLGSRKMEDVFDLGEFNCNQVVVSVKTLSQLLRIALFDLWLANEDRTCNNYNLLYDIREGNLVSIDYGGIFNSGIMKNPIYQLDAVDSIISSDLFCRLKAANTQKVLSEMHIIYLKMVAKCKKAVPAIMDRIPQEWEVDKVALESKLQELFAPAWINETWINFKDLIEKA